MKTCPSCNEEENDDDERFCIKCGFVFFKSDAEDMEEISNQQTDESKTENESDYAVLFPCKKQTAGIGFVISQVYVSSESVFFQIIISRLVLQACFFLIIVDYWQLKLSADSTSPFPASALYRATVG